MKKNYMELSRYINSYFPDTVGKVSGSVDRPPEMWIIISQVTSLLQICGMAFVVFGDSLLETFGLNPANTPKWLNSAKENKMGVFFALFFLNNYANSHLATGAFEVVYNGRTVFSKLEMGRMPNVDEVLKGMEAVRREYAQAQATVNVAA
mmetsp:Transcript_2612/g.4958  ORF Transcript_2612/g.4958 Transcript_2612/m.4958 type:complete len:150 (+) Transcript_2612:258-707(+)|eukprot:CAMPEP_0182455986 /NCGR_PEP_ID=MMETSP1319-20130603/1976_1 /TAXON_ID=172717 /ORGANISM="Bolidomonas pacifica, Strain RCC208" /LENGTH=149 /DNA_ID=CAMNT_0024654159 /DNA_START=236 /DNA_END=685 /DNA_ORIENTATION=-